ncbi:uncharacterized protein LOC130598424 [Pezoporus wallicus]|uniref:uncharacterized protein LOC130598424 n=1 Tax=Pezoporus wallicus TaxID=35540 RepID=UPI00254E0F05|nr:uncharacterized protein LOC130598424 [Pezoporus wallicus]
MERLPTGPRHHRLCDITAVHPRDTGEHPLVPTVSQRQQPLLPDCWDWAWFSRAVAAERTVGPGPTAEMEWEPAPAPAPSLCAPHALGQSADTAAAGPSGQGQTAPCDTAAAATQEERDVQPGSEGHDNIRIPPLSNLSRGPAREFSGLSFPQRLWKILESSEFRSIWWGMGGKCVAISEELFQQEVLGRVFSTQKMNSFLRQLYNYGFTRVHPDSQRSASLPEFLAEEAAASSHSKVLYYHSPSFSRERPQLLEQHKRKAAIKRKAPGAPQEEEEHPPRSADAQPAAPGIIVFVTSPRCTQGIRESTRWYPQAVAAERTVGPGPTAEMEWEPAPAPAPSLCAPHALGQSADTAAASPSGQGQTAPCDTAAAATQEERDVQPGSEGHDTVRIPPLSNRSRGPASEFSGLSFPQRLWKILESSEFRSIWWGMGGKCVAISEELFQQEVLGRVFSTQKMNSFLRQLYNYGFTRVHPDSQRSASLPEFLAEEAAASSHSKVLYYHSPSFSRERPQLLEQHKRKAAIKRKARGAAQEEEEHPPRSADAQPAVHRRASPPAKRRNGALPGPSTARPSPRAAAPTSPEPARAAGRESFIPPNLCFPPPWYRDLKSIHSYGAPQ